MLSKEIKANLNKKVMHNGTVYTFVECAYWRDKHSGQFNNSAVLADKLNRRIRVDIGKVDVINASTKFKELEGFR